jgi:hypothetical protein
MKSFFVGLAFIGAVCGLLWLFISTAPWSIYGLLAFLAVAVICAVGDHVLGIS